MNPYQNRNRVMGKATSDAVAIDEAIEHFEDHWSVESANLIEEVASATTVNDAGELLAELVRVDIDRRYSAGVDVSLHHYSERFPQVFALAEYACAICYEDFRSRRSANLACPPARWMGFTGVSSEKWFQELLQQTQLRGMDSVLAENPTTASLMSSHHDFPTVNVTRAVDTGVGQIIGDFELLAFLGKGAFSRVFLARQRSLGRRFVAIKVVDRPMQEQFHLARLQHTGIVPLFSCHEFHGRWVLCMPYSGALTVSGWMKNVRESEQRTGNSLVEAILAAQQRLLDSGEPAESSAGVPNDGLVPVKVITDEMRAALVRWHAAGNEPLKHVRNQSVSEVLQWLFIRMAESLAHAHQRGIIHGDLKPANILIRNDGQPALIDFNLSRHTQNRPKAWMGGTLPYFCREQLEQLRDHTTGAARAEYDIHSLGVIMYEMLEGRYPFDPAKGNTSEELTRVIELQREPPEFHSSHATAGMRAIICKCITPEVADKYANAGELAEDLLREQQNRPLAYAREPLVQGRLRKVMRRYPKLLTGGTMALITAVILGMFSSSYLNSLAQAERLNSVERLELLADVGDQASEVFAVTGANGEGQPLTASEIADRTMRALGVAEVDALRPAWNKMLLTLTDAERQAAEQSLFSISMPVVQAMILERIAENDSGNAEDFKSDPFLSTILALLPERMQQSQLKDYVRDLGPLDGQAVVSETANMAEMSAEEALLTATACMRRGNPDRAIEILQAFSPPNCYWPAYWNLMANCQRSLGDYRNAAASFSVALSVTGRNPEILLSRGICLMKLRKFDEATALFSELLERFPEVLEYRLQRALTSIATADYGLAEQDLEYALKIDPESVRIRLSLAKVFLQTQRQAEADDIVEEILQGNASNRADCIARAQLRIRRDPDLALTELQDAEARFGPQPEIMQPMAHVLSECLDRPEESIRVLDRLLERYPLYPMALCGRAVLNARDGNWAAAQQDLQVLQGHPGLLTDQIRYQIACAYCLGARENSDLKDPAYRWLSRAITGGYGRDLLTTDPDLQAVRGSAEFESIRKVAILLDKSGV